MQDLTASNLTLSLTCTPLLSLVAILRDCPMMITMTAAASNAVDNEQPPTHPISSLLDKFNPDSFSLFLQDWNTFYNEFIQSTTHQLANLTATPFKCDAVDAANHDLSHTHIFSSEMNALHNELNQLIHSSSASLSSNSDNRNTEANDKSDNEECKNDKWGLLDRDNTNCNNKNYDTDNDSDASSALSASIKEYTTAFCTRWLRHCHWRSSGSHRPRTHHFTPQIECPAQWTNPSPLAQHHFSISHWL